MRDRANKEGNLCWNFSLPSHKSFETMCWYRCLPYEKYIFVSGNMFPWAFWWMHEFLAWFVVKVPYSVAITLFIRHFFIVKPPNPFSIASGVRKDAKSISLGHYFDMQHQPIRVIAISCWFHGFLDDPNKLVNFAPLAPYMLIKPSSGVKMDYKRLTLPNTQNGKPLEQT